MAVTSAPNRYSQGPSPSGLADVLDLILDKGLVIDLYVRVSLVGIELITVDARIVIASVDTYLRFAEAVGRLSLSPPPPTPIELVRTGKQRFTKAAAGGAIDAITEKILPDEEER